MLIEFGKEGRVQVGQCNFVVRRIYEMYKLVVGVEWVLVPHCELDPP